MSAKQTLSELIQNSKNVKIHTKLNYFFRNDLILAYTPNIHLVGTNNFDGSHLFKNVFDFKKICKLNDVEIDTIQIDEIIRDKTTNVKPLEILKNV